jgi:regulator of replication initiation timing
LNDHVTSKNAMIAELQRQLEDYKRQMERSFSQNRLAQIRSDSIRSVTSTSTSSVSTDHSIGKRRRKR